MSLTYHFRPDIGVLFVRGQGVIPQPERIETMLAWMRDPEYARCLDTFCDFSAVETTPKLAELHEVVAEIKQHFPQTDSRKLAIVTSKPIAFGVMRVFDDLVRLAAIPLQVRVFFDADLAWAWLRPSEGRPAAL